MSLSPVSSPRARGCSSAAGDQIELLPMGPRDAAPVSLRLAGGVRRLQRQPIQRTGGGEVYSRPGAAPPQDFLSGRIHRLPEGAPDPLRRAAYLGVVSAAPTGAVVAVDALPPTAHAVGYSLLPSGLKTKAWPFIKRHQC